MVYRGLGASCTILKLASSCSADKGYLGDATELAQRGLGTPHAVIDHEAQGLGLSCQVGPASAQAHLEQAAHEPACALGHVHHVR